MKRFVLDAFSALAMVAWPFLALILALGGFILLLEAARLFEP